MPMLNILYTDTKVIFHLWHGVVCAICVFFIDVLNTRSSCGSENNRNFQEAMSVNILRCLLQR